MYQLSPFFILFLSTSCEIHSDNDYSITFSAGMQKNKAGSIKEITLPKGYHRINQEQSSFGEWLRLIRLKEDHFVYHYDGTLKKNQTTHVAVLDITIGNKDLQQCADAIIRLRAEYLYKQQRYNEISFVDNQGKKYAWVGGSNNIGFERYLENVFSYCNTASLVRQLRLVSDWQQVQPGDVFIKGGFPGHAMIVMDAARDEKGGKIFLLAQSFMPAQSIHIVINPINEKFSPWYEMDESGIIVTPDWTFNKNQMYRF